MGFRSLQKAEAIVRSSFAEVLYIDSDNILARDPSVSLHSTGDRYTRLMLCIQFIFDDPLYLEQGVIIWPDFNRDGGMSISW